MSNATVAVVGVVRALGNTRRAVAAHLAAPTEILSDLDAGLLAGLGVSCARLDGDEAVAR
jgi:hypothetical protein